MCIGFRVQLICAFVLDNNIGNEGAHALAESLKQNTALTKLNLGGTSTKSQCCYTIRVTFQSDLCIFVHFLDGFISNKIGDDGARALAESLKQNTTLTSLNLKSTSAKSQCCYAIKK